MGSLSSLKMLTISSIYTRLTSTTRVLAVCEEAKYSKNMSHADIVRAIENLVKAGVSLEGQFLILNHWQR